MPFNSFHLVPFFVNQIISVNSEFVRKEVCVVIVDDRKMHLQSLGMNHLRESALSFFDLRIRLSE